MVETVQPIMKEDYYVTNFHTLASFVVSTYEDILKEDEIQWYARLRLASPAAQRLYIRLLTRKRSTLRISRLHYPEINNIQTATAELGELGLATSEPPVQLSELLSSFTKPELLELLDLPQPRHVSRAILTSDIEKSPTEFQARFAKRLQAADQWLSINGYQYWMLMQLCFFGNLYQDSREFVLQQLGALTYENYALDQTTRAFASREQVEAHWHYYESELLFECADQRNTKALVHLANTLPAYEFDDINLVRRMDRLRNRIARQLERLAQHDEAALLYEKSVHPPARERRVRLMMRKGHWQEASDLACQMLDNPYNEPEQAIGKKLYTKCQSLQGLRIKKPLVFKPASSKLILSDQGVRVEELARRYYAERGECLRTENTLINAVLGLFIWDIMFYPVPGVFYNPFQSAPSDFNEPEFVQRRASMLNERFNELADQRLLRKRVLEAYETHRGKQNRLVRWQALSPHLLTIAIERIPSGHWQALFERILSDPRENMAGFPDLILFPDNGGYEFIEIKGPGDTLQTNQRTWMQYFDRHGIPCRLVHIRYRQP